MGRDVNYRICNKEESEKKPNRYNNYDSDSYDSDTRDPMYRYDEGRNNYSIHSGTFTKDEVLERMQELAKELIDKIIIHKKNNNKDNDDEEEQKVQEKVDPKEIMDISKAITAYTYFLDQMSDDDILVIECG